MNGSEGAGRLSHEGEAYIRSVLARIPRPLPAHARIEADLRLHLGELIEELGSWPAALERMGPPDQVATEVLGQLWLDPAPHGRRFLAFMIDLCVIVFPFVPLIALAAVWGEAHPAVPILIAVSVLFGILGLLYFPALEAIHGRTLGKWLLDLCVVREDGARVGWGAALIRRIPFVGNFLPLDAIFVFFTRRRQRAFDKVAGTVVVRCSRDAATPEAGRDPRPVPA